MTNHKEFKDALDAWNDARFAKGGFALAHNDTIRRSLLIADRLMEPPSSNMNEVICYSIEFDQCIFKAIRGQLLAETTQQTEMKDE